ncbi:MAG TPA: hypothetical protein PKE62_03210 [Anaerolineales bacterium]|nr:hypothetical protein [Anaerolineales bacterium]
MNSTDQTARFWAYSNYLIALSRLIESEYTNTEDLIKFVTSSKGFAKIHRGKDVDLDAVAQSLRLSWYTELLLTKVIPHKDILPYATPWSMVQTYYAIYPTIRAYFMTMGRVVDKSHETSIRTIGSDFISCKDRFPYPWCCALEGDPSKTIFSLLGDKYQSEITLSNPLNSPYTNDPREYFGLFLRTTRERLLERKIEWWKKENNKKRILKAEKSELIRNLRPTNMLDALYRVRSRSNYQDIDSFAFTQIHEFDYLNLQTAMCKIAGYTLAVFETILARALGKTTYRRIVGDFAQTPLGNFPDTTYLRRWDLINQSAW